MQIRTLLAGSAMLALLAGCASGPTETPEDVVEVTGTTYQGMFPCRSCDGIDISVTLVGEDGSLSADRTFKLRATYRAHPENPPVENRSGSWAVLNGSAEDPSATVYELVPNDEGRTYHFLKLDSQALELVDPKLRRFENNEMLRLNRQ